MSLLRRKIELKLNNKIVVLVDGGEYTLKTQCGKTGLFQLENAETGMILTGEEKTFFCDISDNGDFIILTFKRLDGKKADTNIYLACWRRRVLTEDVNRYNGNKEKMEEILPMKRVKRFRKELPVWAFLEKDRDVYQMNLTRLKEEA